MEAMSNNIAVETSGGLVVRDMVREDIEGMLEIRQLYLESKEGFAEDVADVIGYPDTIMLSAECNGDLLGYVGAYIERKQIVVGCVLIHPCVWRRGIGTALMDRLKLELQTRNLKAIMACVYDDSLAGQLFLKAMGFRYVHTTCKDEYRFIYRPSKL